MTYDPGPIDDVADTYARGCASTGIAYRAFWILAAVLRRRMCQPRLGERSEHSFTLIHVVDEASELMAAVFDEALNHLAKLTRTVNQDLHHLIARNRRYL